MNAKTLKRANEIITRIEYLKRHRKRIETKQVFKMNMNLSEDILAAGIGAMITVVDEESSALEKELEKL